MPDDTTVPDPEAGGPTPVANEELLRLKQELLEEIKKQDELKKKILESFPVKRSWSDVLNTPAVLLVLGFFLTSVVGTILTSSWQARDKRKQDAQLIKELDLKNKTEIMNQSYTLILQTYSASSDMIALFQRGELPDIRQKVLLERMDYWQKTSREWREKYPLLEKRIARQFRDDKIHEGFLEVVRLRGLLGIEVPNWRSAIFEKGWKLIDEKCDEKKCSPKCGRADCPVIDCTKPSNEKYFFNRVRCTNLSNEEMKRQALETINRMMTEIKADEDSSGERQGFFGRLWHWII